MGFRGLGAFLGFGFRAPRLLVGVLKLLGLEASSAQGRRCKGTTPLKALGRESWLKDGVRFSTDSLQGLLPF